MIAAGPLVKEARRKAGLSQAELARRLGTTQSAIARLEKPGANPRLETLIDAVEATGHAIDAKLTSGPGLDETMIAANLRMPPAERLRQFAAAYRSVSELVRDARRNDGP
jgi:transcriptional regulator with XRE-family HTH domain